MQTVQNDVKTTTGELITSSPVKALKDHSIDCLQLFMVNTELRRKTVDIYRTVVTIFTHVLIMLHVRQ
jgi:hypothetical protein